MEYFRHLPKVKYEGKDTKIPSLFVSMTQTG